MQQNETIALLEMFRFNGSRDSYDHSFKTIARAVEVFDLHALGEGFGLTLEVKASLLF